MVILIILNVFLNFSLNATPRTQHLKYSTQHTIKYRQPEILSNDQNFSTSGILYQTYLPLGSNLSNKTLSYISKIRSP